MDRDVGTTSYVHLGSVLASLIGKLTSKEIQFLNFIFFSALLLFRVSSWIYCGTLFNNCN